MLDNLNIKDLYIPKKLSIYNNKNSYVLLSKGKTTKGLRHIEMRGNAIRELQAMNSVNVQHIGGAMNLSDM